uniref:Uncharacterized protein n=1 Tax=Trichogramma kaykai TaxID=54128 RepID=A0ABD2WCI5_9HYME
MRIYIDVIHVTSRVIDANAIGQLLVRRCCAYTYGRIAAAVDGRYDQFTTDGMCASELAFTERCEQILGGCEGEKVKHPQNFVIRKK